ncbi:hypothetical protein BDC45DRAFT_522431, partial [Circinella umbellata]
MINTNVPLIQFVLAQINHYRVTCVLVIVEVCKYPKEYPEVDIPATLNQNSYQCLQVHLRQRTMNLHPNTRILRQPKKRNGKHHNTKN